MGSSWSYLYFEVSSMTKYNGYAGRVLRINLSRKTTTEEVLEDNLAQNVNVSLDIWLFEQNSGRNSNKVKHFLVKYNFAKGDFNGRRPRWKG